MSDNIFLFDDTEDKERVEDLKTAELFDKAVITDIGNAVAYTDGNRIFINTNEKLYKLLPHYDEYKMLKWLLWHEEFHKELFHHKRFHEFVDRRHTPVNLEQQEVNIIMDILVHDSLCKMFPELIETARANCAQLRDCNSLHYPFKARDLMAMLEEYSEYKKEQEGKGTPSGGGGSDTPEDEDKDETSDDTDETPMNIDNVDGPAKDDDSSTGSAPIDDIPTSQEVDPTSIKLAPASNSDSKEPKNKIKEPDWSILDDIDEEEFIDKWEGEELIRQAKRLQIKRINMGKITRKLASLSTTIKERTYRRPSRRQGLYGNVLAKGKICSQASLYLIFDASSSMYNEMQMFKEIISVSVPGAMNTPTEWFAGSGADAKTKNQDPESETLKKLVLNAREHAHKGVFKDFMKVQARNGTGCDGDNVIELCYAAEQKGFTPIAVSDLQCSNLTYKDTSPTWDIVAKLRRTIIVGPEYEKSTFDKIKEHNSHIQVFMV